MRTGRAFPKPKTAEEGKGKTLRIYGLTEGLKHSQINALERLQRRRVPPQTLITPELAARMAEVSADTGRQVAVLLNRTGSVEYVVSGNARSIELPDLKRSRVGRKRFRGLRCIHTHLDGSGLSKEDLTDLALLRLDTMSALEVSPDGVPRFIHTAHVRPAPTAGETREEGDFWTILPPVPVHSLDLDYQAFIRDLEAEFTRIAPTSVCGTPQASITCLRLAPGAAARHHAPPRRAGGRKGCKASAKTRVIMVASALSRPAGC